MARAAAKGSREWCGVPKKRKKVEEGTIKQENNGEVGKKRHGERELTNKVMGIVSMQKGDKERFRAERRQRIELERK